MTTHRVTSFVYVTHKVDGFHRWPDAPDEVGFLRDLHRHLFHIKLSIQVNYNDRDIEFFTLQRELIEIIPSGQNMDSNSCEDICDIIFRRMSIQYPNRTILIEVSEDGENGAIKAYEAIDER